MRFTSSLSILAGIAALAATMPTDSAASSAGCGQPPPLRVGTSKAFEIKSSGGSRSFIVHLPKNYKENVQAPLIFSFHGNHRNASSQETLSRFDDDTWNPNAIAVYPQGINASTDSWEGAPYSAPGVSDKKFTSDLVDHLESIFCVDKSRIYATGKSNGGGFCNVLACSPTLSARFAAFAPAAGAFYTGNAGNDSGCHPARTRIPFMEFHGLADHTIPYEGGKRHDGASLPNVLDFMARWAERNKCDEKATITPSHEGMVKHYTWSCDGDTTQHWAIAGMGHDWPSTTENSDNKGSVTYIDATPIIMRFFAQHSLP